MVARLVADLVAGSGKVVVAGSLDDVSQGKPVLVGLRLRSWFEAGFGPKKVRSLDHLEDVADGGVVADRRDVSTRRG